MILYLDGNRRVLAYKDDISEAMAKAEEARGAGVFYDGDFDFFMGEDKPGFEKAFYLETDGTIRIDYTAIPIELITPLSEQEQIAIDTALNVEYIACLMEANLQ